MVEFSSGYKAQARKQVEEMDNVLGPNMRTLAQGLSLDRTSTKQASQEPAAPALEPAA